MDDKFIYIDNNIAAAKDEIAIFEKIEEALNEVFHSWHKKHKLFPNYYRILNDEVIEVR